MLVALAPLDVVVAAVLLLLLLAVAGEATGAVQLPAIQLAAVQPLGLVTCTPHVVIRPHTSQPKETWCRYPCRGLYLEVHTAGDQTGVCRAFPWQTGHWGADVLRFSDACRSLDKPWRSAPGKEYAALTGAQHIKQPSGL